MEIGLAVVGNRVQHHRTDRTAATVGRDAEVIWDDRQDHDGVLRQARIGVTPDRAFRLPFLHLGGGEGQAVRRQGANAKGSPEVQTYDGKTGKLLGTGTVAALERL